MTLSEARARQETHRPWILANLQVFNRVIKNIGQCLTVDISVNLDPPPVRAQEIPPVLKEPVSLAIVPWFDGMVGPLGLVSPLHAIEKKVIALASVQNRADLLNIDGR